MSLIYIILEGLETRLYDFDLSFSTFSIYVGEMKAAYPGGYV